MVMNKFQAMVQIMAMINEDHDLIPGSREVKLIRRVISDKIDRLGPEGALVQIMDTKSHLMAQIQSLIP